MTDLRERVARAICSTTRRDPDDIIGAHGGNPVYAWQEHAEKADAAIALMAEECAKVADDMEEEALAIMGEGCPFPDEYWPSCVAAAIRALATKEGEV